MRKYYMPRAGDRYIEANAQVAQSLFKQATNRDKVERLHAIFWLKSAIKWRGTARRRWAKGSPRGAVEGGAVERTGKGCCSNLCRNGTQAAVTGASALRQGSPYARRCRCTKHLRWWPWPCLCLRLPDVPGNRRLKGGRGLVRELVRALFGSYDEQRNSGTFASCS